MELPNRLISCSVTVLSSILSVEREKPSKSSSTVKYFSFLKFAISSSLLQSWQELVFVLCQQNNSAYIGTSIAYLNSFPQANPQSLLLVQIQRDYRKTSVF